MSEVRDPRTNPRRGDLLQKHGKVSVSRKVVGNVRGYVSFFEHKYTEDGEKSCERESTPLHRWCNWALDTDMLKKGNYKGHPRDPRTVPVFGDVVRRRDLESKAKTDRLVMGTTSMKFKDIEKVEVQYRLIRSPDKSIRSCSLSAWRQWAHKATTKVGK